MTSRRLVARLGGHHAFTTKDCPFLLFTHDDGGVGASGPPPPLAALAPAPTPGPGLPSWTTPSLVSTVHQPAGGDSGDSSGTSSGEGAAGAAAAAVAAAVAVEGAWEPPVGDLVCSGSEDCAAYIWSVRHGRLVRVLRGHGDVVSAVGWCPRVRGLLATASDDFTVRLWARAGTTVHCEGGVPDEADD